jgi:hypothetical protein
MIAQVGIARTVHGTLEVKVEPIDPSKRGKRIQASRPFRSPEKKRCHPWCPADLLGQSDPVSPRDGRRITGPAVLAIAISLV